MIHEERRSTTTSLSDWKRLASATRRWSWTAHIYILAFVLMYGPVLREAWQQWFKDENQAHGVFIIPISLFLLWKQQDAITQARCKPVAWGLIPLALALLLLVGSTLLQVQTLCFGMWSLVLALFGSILIWHGWERWRLFCFPVLFLLLAGGIPGKLVLGLSAQLQRISSTFAALLMQTLGYPVLRAGNIIEVPGYQLEVAEACSGIKKVVALLAFSLVYGYLFRIGTGKRLVLFLATIPIAVMANIIRVAGLIAVTYYGGVKALHIAHDWAELFVLVIAFLMFVGLGKVLGCKTLRFSL